MQVYESKKTMPGKPTLQREKIFHPRDYDLAAKLADFENDFLVGPREVSAFTGIARSSIHKIKQREKIGMPEPSPIGGRHLIWQLGVIRQWISRGTAAAPLMQQKARVGRPTKAEELARSRPDKF